MSADPNKKRPRTFQCRDAVWETFEQMAKDLECSVDYLVNEAMKQYARSKNYGSSQPSMPSLAPPALGQNPGMGQTARSPSRLPPPPARTSQLPAPQVQRQQSRVPASMPPPLPQQAAARAKAPPPAVPAPAGSNIGARRLSVFYRGEKVQVSKDRFVIGRGKQTSDLTLKDPNVSRQHAMVELQSGTYFMVDMGSTNGVEFNGQRVARKPILEGDTFIICEHELKFTYQ